MTLGTKGDQNQASEDGKTVSQFHGGAEAMRERLGHSLCLAKWQQTSLHLTTGQTNSCYHPPLHSMDPTAVAEDPSALHNTQHKKLERAAMLAGKRPSGCSYCWRMEDQGDLSDRHYRSSEPWAAQAFQDILSKDPMAWNVTPSYVEVNFSNACNLRCSYCSPQFSSTWAKEAKEHGAYPTRDRHNDPVHFTAANRNIPRHEGNPYVEAFWRWWPDLYPSLTHFRMTGGEPLMDKNTLRVLDHVLANPKPDLHVNVTSNFSVEPQLFTDYISRVKAITEGGCVEHFMQFVSLDAWDERAEYIRHGLDFGLLKRNVETYLREVPQRSSLTFIITMNVLNVSSLRQLLSWILELRETHSQHHQRIWFDTPLLRSPQWMSLEHAGEAWALELQTTLAWMELHHERADDLRRGFKDYELDRLRRVWHSVGRQPDRDHGIAVDFHRFFTEHDRRRGTDFAATFPELQEYWDESSWWSSQHG
jgi:organic radical activating enzyme